MKKTTALLAAACLVASCSKGVKYDITVKNLGSDCKMIYLQNVESEEKDSVEVQNGVAHLQGTMEEATLAEVRVPGTTIYVPIIVDGEPITMTYADNDVTLTTGSSVNMQLNAFCDAIHNFKVQERQLSADAQLMAEKSGGQLEPQDYAMLMKRYEEISGAVTSTVKSLLEANADNLAPVYILSSRMNPLEVEDVIDFMATYKYADRDILLPLRQQIEAKSRMLPGAEVTDVVIPDLEGNEHHITDYVGKGNITLVDFWASWCGPCRREMPTVVEAYAKYHDKGFEVLGISLDNKKEDWEKAIGELGITWPQLSDLKGWQCEAAGVYGVRAIPCTILFDAEGKVIASNLRGEDLLAKLEELLGGK